MSDEQAGRSDPVLVVGLLGRIRATAQGQELELGGPRQRALLAALAVELGRTVPTDTLIEAVWDGDVPEAAGRTFRSYVSRLRKALGRAGVDGADLVRTDAAGYRLDDRLVEVDARLFDTEVSRARQQLAAGQGAAAVEQLTRALDRWQGRALGAFADRVWAAPTAVRLAEQRLAAEELRVRALLDAQRTADAVTRVEQLAAAEPLRESLAQLQALALYRSGRDADALRTAREFRERLVDEHGLDPSPRLGELEAMILERDPRLDRSVGGRRLRGYVLHEPVARSPLGTVHRAEQPSIGREVAVTVLPPEQADDPDLVRAFEARVQAVAALEHPHVLPVYDYWREPGGAYVVTRFPAGGTLDQRLRSGTLDVGEALRVGEQVASALAAAHEAGIAHGDLGPDAVVVDERGDAFVWGFSLSERSRADDDVQRLAAMVTAAVETDAAAGGVAIAQLPPAVAAACQRATARPSDDAITAAGLARAFAAGRAGAEIVPPGPIPTGPNPYRGLAAFRESDADVFFGREGLVQQLLGRIARNRAAAVVGPSGAGKSSLVRAGLLPELRAQGAFVTTMVPGTRPLAELEVALSRVAAVELDGVADEVAATPSGLGRVVRRLLPIPDGELVLVVDQFEELFTLAEPTERDLLLQALHAVVDDLDAPVRVVASLRADFLGQVLSHATAGALVRDRTVMVTPLTDDELHQVVVRPAEVAGVAVEPALATAIVADAVRSPGSLPMVQFALTEVFEAAEDGTMELSAYRRIGGIEGVLGQRAEEVYAELDVAGQQAAHQLFQRLVVPNDDGPPTRRRSTRSQLAHVPDPVLEAFGRARLLRFDHDPASREPTVEVTHEALFRAWPRLAVWVEEGEDDLRLLGHLAAAAREWDVGGRAEPDLYRGSRLNGALDFADRHPGELSEVERAFLVASETRRARQADVARRRIRRLRVLTGGLAVGLVLALGAGSIAAISQRNEAEARREAEAAGRAQETATAAEAETARQAQADALAFAATATADEDLELAALLAAEAYAVEPDAESQRALMEVLNHSPQVEQLLEPPPDGRCGSHPGGANVNVTMRLRDGGDAFADVRDFDGNQLATVDLADGAFCPVVDREGRWVLSGEEETGVLRSYDTTTGEVLGVLEGWRHPGLFQDVQLHPTRDEALVVTPDDRLLRVRLPDLEVIAEPDISPGPGGVLSATYGESGDLLAALVGESGVPESRAVVVTDMAGDVVASTSGVEAVLEAVVAEGQGLVLTASELGTASVFALDDPEVVISLGLRGGTNGPIAVGPDGELAAFATSEGLEVVDLTRLTLVGDPIGVDTTFGVPGWGPDGELYFQGPAGFATVDLDRAVGTGEVVADLVPTGFGLWPAPDGSGAIQLAEPDVLWVDTASGDEVVTAPAPTTFRPVVALPERGWATIDLEERVFQRWEGDQLMLEADLPSTVPEGLERIWALLRADNGVAVHIASELAERGDGPVAVRRHLLAVDVTTGQPLAHQVFDLGDRSEAPLQARALGRDRLYVAFEDGHGEIRSMDGEVLHSRDDLVGNGESIGVAEGGSLLASTDIADAVTVVDDQLEPVARLTGFASTAWALLLLDDETLATRHADGSTFLWDLTTSQLRGRLFTSDGLAPYGVAAARDGSALLHATPGGIVRIPIDADRWLDDVCAVISRPLQQVELEAVAPGREPLDPCGPSGGA